MKEVIVALSALIIALIQTSLIGSLPTPLNLIPLPLIIGTTLLHRTTIPLGIIWTLTCVIFIKLTGFPTIPSGIYTLMLCAAIPLCLRIFAQRSLWGLQGLGISMFVVGSLAQTLPTILFQFFNRDTIHDAFFKPFFSEQIVILAWLITGLYIAQITARKWQDAKNQFLPRTAT